MRLSYTRGSMLIRCGRLSLSEGLLCRAYFPVEQHTDAAILRVRHHHRLNRLPPIPQRCHRRHRRRQPPATMNRPSPTA